MTRRGRGRGNEETPQGRAVKARQRRAVLALLAVTGAALLGVFAWRRLLPPPSVVPAVPEVARATRAGRPVIFVGLDGADWQLLDRYIGMGVMPNLAALVQSGSAGEL